jgi:uncharacterized membrane protein (TIGR02234 family)
VTDRVAPRRTYALTLVAGLTGAVATAVGVSRPWVVATSDVPGLPRVTAAVDGADVAPVAAALSFVLIAAFGAVIATRGRTRRAIGVLVVVCGLVVLGSALLAGSSTDVLESTLSARGWSGGEYDQGVAAWRWVVVIASAVCVLAGAAVVRYGDGWATMGARYDAPTAQERTPPPADSWSEAEVWKAIDSGHDPTQAQPEQRRPQ